MCQSVNGQNSITPTESSVSEKTWAQAPSTNEKVHILLRLSRKMIAPSTTPKSSEWVKPTPGKPRCSWTGSSTSLALPLKSRP